MTYDSNSVLFKEKKWIYTVVLFLLKIPNIAPVDRAFSRFEEAILGIGKP